MKRMRLAFFLLVLAMVASPAFTQNEDDEWQWRVEPPSTLYSATYHLFRHGQPVRCIVNIRGDGSGANIVSEIISGRGTENEIDFLQTIDIDRGDSGVITAKESRYSQAFQLASPDYPFNPALPFSFPQSARKNIYLRAGFVEDRLAPDVFRTYYLEAGRKLPPEAQAKFFGKYL